METNKRYQIIEIQKDYSTHYILECYDLTPLPKQAKQALHEMGISDRQAGYMRLMDTFDYDDILKYANKHNINLLSVETVVYQYH